MIFIDHFITQTGKNLVCTNENGKIIINKFENKISRIVFNLDDTIPGRLYFAMLNPVTGKYSMMPIVDGAITITTKISAYPGIWNTLLLGIQDDYDVADENIDQSKVTFVSNEFKRIVVKDNFLSEDTEDIETVENPEIDELIDNMITALNAARNITDRLDEQTVSVLKDMASILKTDGSGDEYLSDDGDYDSLITKEELDSILEEVLTDET